MHKIHILTPSQFSRMREVRLSPDELTHVNSYRLLEKVMQKRKATATPEEMYALYHQLLQKSNLYKTIADKEAVQRETGIVPKVFEPTVRTVQTGVDTSATPPLTPRTRKKQQHSKALRKRLGISLTAQASPPKRVRRGVNRSETDQVATPRRIVRGKRRAPQTGSGVVLLKWCSLPKQRER